MNNKHHRWIRPLQHFFYIAFVILWFKDNFAPLRGVTVHYLFALVPWLGLTVFRLYPRIRQTKIVTHRKLSRETAAFLLILLLTIILRLPFLAAPSGLMTSDDAVPALMGKHIAEGKTPPVCYYGVLYLGSLSNHFYALAFKVFGYSMFVLKWATLFVFLGFMVVQFVFLKEVFSSSLALAVSFFYSLPITPLVRAGLDNSAGYALVLLLGSLLLYLSYLVGARSRENLLPGLGLTIGLAFWTHQITMTFIAVSLLMLIVRFGWQFRKYVALIYWAFLGFLPQFLAEAFCGFKLIPFLMRGESAVNKAKANAALDFTVGLLTPDSPRAGLAFLLLALAGVVCVVMAALKKKKDLTQIVFALCPAIFYLLYVLSDYSTRGVIQYHFPLYVVLPVLLIAVFQFMRPWAGRTLSFTLFLCLFFFFNLDSSLQLVKSTQDRHLRITRLAAAMEDTGCRYWRGEYWTSYLLAAVSGERLIVDSYSFNRYLPYSLAYWNNTNRDNFVFILSSLAGEIRDGEKENHTLLARWLKTLGIRHELREVEGAGLIYDVEPRVFNPVPLTEPPARIPTLELDRVEPKDGCLDMIFRNIVPDKLDLDFWLAAEIPGFSVRRERFSPAQPEVRMHIPHPLASSFVLRFFIECAGIKVPSSEREVVYSLPDGVDWERSDPVVYLRGIRPDLSRRRAPRMICEKEAWFEVNRKSPSASGLRLTVVSPFVFRSWQWYGKYIQQVEIAVNGTSVGKWALNDGKNVLDIKFANNIIKPGANLVSLKFQYSSWFPTRSSWPFSAYLERIKLT